MESKPKNSLLRFITNDGNVIIDPVGKANGRGVYLCKDEECFKKAKKRKALSRGLSVAEPSDDKYEELHSEFAVHIRNRQNEE
jgi:predicted RNA-binding protein YlxR (DUF448 family)